MKKQFLVVLLLVVSAASAKAQDADYITFPKTRTNWRPNPPNAVYPLYDRHERIMWWNDSTYTQIPTGWEVDAYDSAQAYHNIKVLRYQCVFLLDQVAELHRQNDSLINEIRTWYHFKSGSSDPHHNTPLFQNTAGQNN